mmetsp:Transcript_16461/g.39405  ORF Transcript_16461/g.39405 Transcript_16461/m.39405 type:complete len:273 (+) Transcript_16461:487-1305(+)
MRDLVCALTPTIKRQRTVLRSIGFDINGGPEDVSQEQMNPLRSLDFIAIDFFVAILSCDDLSSLNISFLHSFSLTNALLEATKQLTPGEMPMWNNLHNFTLGLDICSHPPPSLSGDQYLQSSKKLLEIFSHCQKIQRVSLSLPKDIWANNLKSVRNVLCDKPNMSTLSLFLDGYDDSDENILQLLEDCILNKGFKRACWQCSSLSKVNGSRFFKLMQCIKDAGGYFSGLSGWRPGESHLSHLPFTFEHGANVNEGDLPENYDIDHWWMTLNV